MTMYCVSLFVFAFFVSGTWTMFLPKTTTQESAVEVTTMDILDVFSLEHDETLEDIFRSVYKRNDTGFQDLKNRLNKYEDKRRRFMEELTKLMRSS